MVLLMNSCSSEERSNDQIIIESSLEITKDDSFVAGDFLISGAKGQTDEFSREGKFSYRSDKLNEYGLSYVIQDVKKGDVIVFSAWKLSKNNRGSLVISDNKENGQYISSGRTTIKEGEWGLVECYFVAERDVEEVRVYAHNPHDEPAFFDDVKIEIYKNNAVPDDSIEALEIKLDDAAFAKIASYREIALEQGVITKDLKKYVKGFIVKDGKELPIELRIKGDWTDHLKTDKWSFRIKVKGENAYDGLKSFSIQSPSTRGFMDEWFAHKLFDREDVLTTRYKFIPVIINGERKGVYALEEHFDKQLLESRNRREAPIVKFDESGIWEHHLHGINDSAEYTVPVLLSADIAVFKNGRTYRTPYLKNLFRIAQSQMNRYRNHDADVTEYLDGDSYAKFIALSDVLNGKHGLIWHNQRFYINPLTNKLEPIGYDCFTEREMKSYELKLEGFSRANKFTFSLVQAGLSHPDIEKKYIEYLKQFSAPEYLSQVFSELEEEIRATEELLNFEDPSVRFDKNFFFSNCERIKELLPDYEIFAKKPTKELNPFGNFKPIEEDFLYEKIALKAYTIEKSELTTSIRLRNYHVNPIQIIGYSIKQNKDSVIAKSISMKGFQNEYDEFRINLPAGAKRIFYTAENCGKRIFTAKVNKWDAANDIRFVQSQLPKFIQEGKGNELIVSTGVYKANRDIIIPAGKRLIVNEGVELDLIEGAAFISYSPVEFRGTKSQQIFVHSSDSSANGVTIVAANTSSKLAYTNFSGLSSLTKDNWGLTGAVAIYKSNLIVDHCSFKANNCEDGLNLIQCDFQMKSCSVSQTTSDGFDADFCTGKVIGSTFRDTGNDCIDFSGSKIEIVGATIINAGDKGISGGENSDLLVVDCTINGAYIAVASKDLSKVHVTGLSIEASEYGFAAYRKKPEYGAATIVVESIKKNNSEKLHLLEKESKLKYLEEEFVGEKMFNIDSMYMMYKK